VIEDRRQIAFVSAGKRWSWSLVCRPGLGDLPPTVTEQPIQNQSSDCEMAVTEIPVKFRLGIPGSSGRNWRTIRRNCNSRGARCTSIWTMKTTWSSFTDRLTYSLPEVAVEHGSRWWPITDGLLLERLVGGFERRWRAGIVRNRLSVRDELFASRKR
jgi:hypothetical protein